MGKGSGSCERQALSVGDAAPKILLAHKGQQGRAMIGEYDPQTRTLEITWSTSAKEIGKVSTWKDNHPYAGHSISLQQVETGQTGGYTFPPLWKKVDAKQAQQIIDRYQYILDNTVALELPKDSPLAPYQYTHVILESDNPPTLAFSGKGSRDNKTRYVKDGKYWKMDFGSYGKDSGLSFDDMAGGSGIAEMMVKMTAPPGTSKDPFRLSKEEGLAMRQLYKELEARQNHADQ